MTKTRNNQYYFDYLMIKKRQKKAKKRALRMYFKRKIRCFYRIFSMRNR